MEKSNLKTAINLLSEDLQHVDLEDALCAVKYDPTHMNFIKPLSKKEIKKLLKILTNTK